MKITKEHLRQIIKEEVEAVLEEQTGKRRGFFRQMFRMDHPKVDAIMKGYEDAISNLHVEFGEVNSDRNRSNDAYTDLLLKLGKIHGDYLDSWKAASNFDASKEQRARGKEADEYRRDLYSKIEARSDREETNARARRAREQERKAREERERMEREAASSSGGGFDQKTAHRRCREEHRSDLRKGYDEGYRKCMDRAREFADQQSSRYEE